MNPGVQVVVVFLCISVNFIESAGVRVHLHVNRASVLAFINTYVLKITAGPPKPTAQIKKQRVHALQGRALCYLG